MNTVATRFQVTVAGAAVAAAAVFTPIAANAAPAVQLPAAPVSVSDLALAPKGPVYIVTATSLQLLSVFLNQSANSQDRRATRLETYAAANPTSVFGQLAAARAAKLRTNEAISRGVTFNVCLAGNSVGVGPYGTITQGSC
ncbi:hypothetical protein [Mycolicibacterium hodleri]|uniref:Uncharacterized protein n=1 Tax=Mycolicibacterium hodleri TaxID=49897 RepID=A0A502ECP9_9MYCO|nr:hypothetical protein [Mycolicibacterium hodleri]TPG34266.1 hypothetical protein EAH80_11815 [Mycolicibacterium hodleri]